MATSRPPLSGKALARTRSPGLPADKAEEAMVRTHNALPIHLAIALTIVACQPSVQGVTRLSEEDMAAIRTVFAVHRQNAPRSDWAADAALYTEDAVELPPNGSLSEVALRSRQRAAGGKSPGLRTEHR